MKKLLLLLAMSAYLSNSFLAIRVAGAQIYPFRLLLMIALAALLFRTLMPGNGGIVWSSRRKNAYSLVFIMLWVVLASLSALWMKDPQSWFRAIFFLVTGFLLFFLFSTHITREEDLLPILRGVVLMQAGHQLIGWYEVLTGDFRFYSNAAVLQYYGSRAPVSIYGSNEFSGVMFVCLFLSYALFQKTNTKRGRLCYLVSMFSCTGLIMAGDSRGFQAALMVGLVYLFFSLKRGKIALILCGVALILTVPGLLDNLLLNLHFGFVPNDTGSTGIRVNLLRNGLYFLPHSGFLGTGAGQIEYWMGHFSVYPIGTITNIHNWWAELLVGYGIFVFIGYAVFYGKLFLDLREKSKRHQDPIAQAFCCILIGFVIGSVSSSSIMGADDIWLLFAVAVAYQGAAHRAIDELTALENSKR